MRRVWDFSVMSRLQSKCCFYTNFFGLERLMSAGTSNNMWIERSVADALLAVLDKWPMVIALFIRDPAVERQSAFTSWTLEKPMVLGCDHWFSPPSTDLCRFDRRADRWSHSPIVQVSGAVTFTNTSPPAGAICIPGSYAFRCRYDAPLTLTVAADRCFQ